MERKLIKFINSSLSKEFKQFLVNNKPLKRNYYFIVLTFDNEKEDLLKIAEVINDVLENIALAIIDEKLIIFSFDNLELELSDFVQNLEYDLGLKIGAFQSGKLSSEESQNFYKYFLLYQMYLTNKYMITTISDLILDITTKNKSELVSDKDIFLNGIYKDEQYYKLIFALLKNNLNVTKASKDVYMHRNTINNKIEVIKEETGLNIQNFYDAMAIYILIK